jgi:hypothetical protein
VPSKTKDPPLSLLKEGPLTKVALLFLPEISVQPPPVALLDPLVPIPNMLGKTILFCSIIGAAQYVLMTCPTCKFATLKVTFQNLESFSEE